MGAYEKAMNYLDRGLLALSELGDESPKLLLMQAWGRLSFHTAGP